MLSSGPVYNIHIRTEPNPCCGPRGNHKVPTFFYARQSTQVSPSGKNEPVKFSDSGSSFGSSGCSSSSSSATAVASWSDPR